MASQDQTQHPCHIQKNFASVDTFLCSMRTKSTNSPEPCLEYKQMQPWTTYEISPCMC